MRVTEYLVQNKKRLAKGILCFLIIFSILLPTMDLGVRADTADELKEQQEKAEQSQGNIDAHKDEIDNLTGEEVQITSKLNSYNDQLAETIKELNKTEVEIQDKIIEIDEKMKELEEAKVIEEKQYQEMLIHMQYMYENGMGANYLFALFQAGEFSMFLNLAEYMDQISAYDKQRMAEFTMLREYVEEEEENLQQEKRMLDALQLQQKKSKENIDLLVKEAQVELANKKEQILNKENEMTAEEEQLALIKDNIKELQKKLEEELRQSEAAQAGKWRDISQVNFEANDRAMIANLVYCEARGEDYGGKLAVASVIINRLLSERYPDTISGVIYQPYQFAPVKSTKNSFIEALAVDKASANPGCYQAADEAMKGITNVENALYFQTLAYIEKVGKLHVVRFTIGNHGFY